MAYQYQYINKLEQFDRVYYTLVLIDDEGILPDYRNEKSFKIDATDEDLAQEAQNTIDLLVQG